MCTSGFTGGAIPRCLMKELVEAIAKALVDHPEDLGKVIGRQGRTAKAMRTLLGASGMKLHKRFTLEILED